MLPNRAVEKSGFRPLSQHELNVVSGGRFFVTGSRPNSGNPWSGSGDGAGGLGSGLSSFQMIDLSSLGHLATVDWEKFFADMEAHRQSQEDQDGDGQPGITVSRDLMPDTFEEMTFDQEVTFRIFWQLSGNMQFADIKAGTNLSGDNPDDIRNADRKAELEAKLISDAFDALIKEMSNQMNNHIP